ncbi:hypothetical protein EDB85DRAFT_2295072 [Lactarius pseudohatsudake]|nr:hypothetical protein EDB85DRAFT_2295072 [Lactarius pseudohatsudake]
MHKLGTDGASAGVPEVVANNSIALILENARLDVAQQGEDRGVDGIPAPTSRRRHIIHCGILLSLEGPLLESTNNGSLQTQDLSRKTVLFMSILRVLYLNTSAPAYAFYVRNNPVIFYDSVTLVPLCFIDRDFDDFAADVASLSDYIHRQFNNRILAILLGGAVPESARGTVDSTYYTHYSSLSTAEANWGFGSLGRGDDALEHLLHRQRDRPHEPQRLHRRHSADEHHRHDPGPAPRAHHGAEHVGRRRAGGGAVFVASGVDTSFTAAPENLTVQGETVPWLGPRVAAASSNSCSGSGNRAAGAREGMVGATVLGALLAGVAALLLA